MNLDYLFCSAKLFVQSCLLNVLHSELKFFICSYTSFASSFNLSYYCI